MVPGTSAMKFSKELASLLNKRVMVITEDNAYAGTLVGYDLTTLSVCLNDATDKNNKKIPKIFINGRIIREILLTEAPFDMKGLLERLMRVFPKMPIQFIEESNSIIIMDSIKVTPEGVEGEGPIADRVKQIFEEYVAETYGKK
ncbi:hypothetical protein DRO02_03145 [archaeon]|nr:MAG: hypothetical protein DRO02_03145 [archaeon]RLG65235.1 MAG: hypothetical protein DRO21_02405 [archaeon]HDM24296.1 hypothetical protein [Candidatus Bathyarchaeota archaeon]